MSQSAKKQCEHLWTTFTEKLYHLVPLSASHANLQFASISSSIQSGMQTVIDVGTRLWKCRLFCKCCCFHLCYGRVKYLTKGHFCLYQSILLEITKLQNKYINERMKKTYEDLEMGKVTCHPFSQKDMSYLSSGNLPGRRTSLPVQPWAKTQLWYDEEHFSHHCVTQRTAGAKPPDLPSAAPKSIPPPAPCSGGKYRHSDPPQTLLKALVTWAGGVGE